MNAPVVSLSHVRVGPPQALVLEDIELHLEAGHFLGIVGPNGAGKSTLLSVIVGLLQPQAGHVDLFGECLRRFNRRRLLRQVGFVCQMHALENRLPARVKDVIAMGFADYHTPLWRRSGEKELLHHALSQMNLEDMADADFRQLSGGQMQRVRIARALVRQPRLLLLDEPTAGLDTQGQERLYSLLRELCEKESMAIIMVEHDIAAITSYVDSVACLNRRIHHHAMKGEHIPEHVWHAMYGEHMHVVAHDARCIGCAGQEGE